MNVIEHGNKYHDNNHTVKCNKCNCLFEYSVSDIKRDEVRISFYESELVGRYVACPECSAHVNLGNVFLLNNNHSYES